MADRGTGGVALVLLLALVACEDADPVAPEVTDVRWMDVAAAPFHSCAVAEGGDLYCWGSNASGQLGRSEEVDGSARPLRLGVPGAYRTVAAGARHSCAVRVEGGIDCWGDNSFGQLGRPPESVRGFGAPVATPGDFREVVAGDAHTCALGREDLLACWGRNNRGQLGRSTATGSDARPGAVQTDRRFRELTAGAEFTCAVALDGVGYCWGANTTSQLGLGNVLDVTRPSAVEPAWFVFTDIDAGFDRSCALTLEREVACWGAGPGTPVRLDAGAHFLEVTVAGAGWGCAIEESEGVWCWGVSHHSRFGGDDGEAFLTPVPGEAPPPVAQAPAIYVRIDAGLDHWCGITVEGALHCAGEGGSGQLGHGKTADATFPVPVGGY